MKRNDIVTFINESVHYKPGWRFHAEASVIGEWLSRAIWGDNAYDTDSGAVEVEVTFDAPDSDITYARQGYPVTNRLVRSMLIEPSSVPDVEALEGEIFTRLMEIELHESREFFRTTGLQAPFHPHTDTGDERWRAALVRQLGIVDA